jgi:hypothetical protein
MIAEAMSFGDLTCDQCFMCECIFADEEKCRLDAFGFQGIKHPGRVTELRPVIEGKDDLFVGQLQRIGIGFPPDSQTPNGAEFDCPTRADHVRARTRVR